VFLWLENWVSFPATSLPEIEPNSDPESAASQCRRAWGLGDLPIAKLGELLESKGVRLCAAELGETRMDAYSCIMGGRAFTFLGTMKQDRARSRFDAAHELGHLVMHQHLSDEDLEARNQEIENQAHAFASAFLLPRDTFTKDLTDTSIDGFKRLKPKWGVSIQAMVHRAKELEIISEATYSSHFRAIGMRGWRRAQGEPLDEMVPLMNRSLGSKSLDLLEASNKIKPWEISSSLPLPDMVLRSVFGRSIREMVPKELDNVIFLVDRKAPKK
jgi:Zn-dependent peptidase ImmA (M78 family)